MSIASNALLSENRLVVAQVATVDASKEIDSDAMRVAKVKADIQLFLQDSGIRWSDAAQSTAQKESEAEEIRAGERARMNFVSYWGMKKKNPPCRALLLHVIMRSERQQPVSYVSSYYYMYVLILLYMSSYY